MQIDTNRLYITVAASLGETNGVGVKHGACGHLGIGSALYVESAYKHIPCYALNDPCFSFVSVAS
jgi:hypothetical protein